MSRQFNVAVVGATGAVGQTMLSILAERDFPAERVYPLASQRSVGKTVEFGDQTLTIEDLAEFDFGKTHLALFSAGGSVSAEHAPRAAASGCVVVDNTSHFRYDDQVPLVVPEINPHALAGYTSKGIIANPNCSTIQMVVALQPIQSAVGINRINVATYQAVSGSGNAAVEELASQSARLLNGQPIECNVYPKQIAFNALPEIDVYLENGYTKEEMKMVWETHKIFENEDIVVNPTCVRVPVFYGHSEAVHIECEGKLTAARAREILSDADGVCVFDEQKPGGFPSAVTEGAGHDSVFIGRIREDLASPNGLNMWVVSDNVRKGAALNTVQIAEMMIEHYL